MKLLEGLPANTLNENTSRGSRYENNAVTPSGHPSSWWLESAHVKKSSTSRREAVAVALSPSSALAVHQPVNVRKGIANAARATKSERAHLMFIVVLLGNLVVRATDLMVNGFDRPTIVPLWALGALITTGVALLSSAGFLRRHRLAGAAIAVLASIAIWFV